MRAIGVVTVARSDYGIYLPVLRLIQQDPDLRLYLMVTGMHLSHEFGLTVEIIKGDGFEISEQVPMLLSSDTPEGIAKSMGLGTIGFAQCFARFRPDLLLLLGDRFEMHAAAVAALPFNIPLAHLHGGESTEGAIDEAMRHSITKMSHLHFPSTQIYAQRIVQMGEEPWRVTLTGAPSLDNLAQLPLLEPCELERVCGIDPGAPTLLVTYHPVTLEQEDTERQVEELLAALDESDLNVVFTYPNADTGGRRIIELVQRYVDSHNRCRFVANLGPQAYYSLMATAAAMVGNSSSGIIEAASFNLPVVNIGTRQQGRIHDRNVIDVGYERGEILAAIRQASSPLFRASLDGLVNPYGDGHAAHRVVARLKEVELGHELLLKRFYDTESLSLDHRPVPSFR